jgi:ABC-type sugar transport system ATPase subunit
MRGIGKRFSGVPVLKDVDFDLRRGEVHILAGENGAGKSTLIKILAGVHTEYDGEIELEGAPAVFQNPIEATRKGISTIHQEMSLVPAMSVLDNIFLGREHARGGWIDFKAQAGEAGRLLDRLGLDVDLHKTVEEYPISVNQMIEIAKALNSDVRVMIMDEPTSALKDAEVERLFGIIRQLKKQGCGIIYISHRMEEIYRLADRITVLRDGEKIGTSPAAELPRDTFVNWMVGRELKQQFPERKPVLGDEVLSIASFRLQDRGGGRPWGVEDVSLRVRRGEILGLAGLQASGCSRFMHGLFGSFGRAAQGDVTLQGEPFEVGSPGRSIQRGLALLTNDRKASGLVLNMDIPRNITLASLETYSPGGWLDSAGERRAAEAHVGTLGVRATSLDGEVSALSGGNQQKVVLGKWLETKPAVLMLDEPTRGVDVGAKAEIYELMNRWTAEGMAVILITSEMEELLAMADRILVFHRGRIVKELSGREATQEAILKAAMGETEAS